MRTFYKFMGRYPELASNFNKSASLMIRNNVPIVDEIVEGAGCTQQDVLTSLDT